MNKRVKEIASRLGDILETKAFISITAALMIAYGFWYWGDFSNHVDEVAKQLSSKTQQKEQSIEIDRGYSDIKQIILKNSDFSEYAFSEYKGKLYSKLYKRSENVNYKIVIDSLGKDISKLSFKHSKIKVFKPESNTILVGLRLLIINKSKLENT